MTFDKDARTVTIDDNGIGISREEAISHLGTTIARSGTKEFFSKFSGDQAEGCGADWPVRRGLFTRASSLRTRSRVETRRAGLPADKGVRWTSADEDDLLSSRRLKSIIQKYSDHVALPILMKKEEWDAEKSEMIVKDEEDETVNQASALWTRPKNE